MAAVQRGELRLPEALDESKDGRVDEPHIGICIAIAKLAHAGVVGWLEIGDSIGARLNVGEEGDQGARRQALVDPVVDLHENRRRDHDGLICPFDQVPACRVILVRAIERRVQRPCIEDQRQDRGSGRSSPVLRAESVVPDAPAPRLRGFGECRSIVESIASRMTAAIEMPRSDAIRRSRRRVSRSRVIVVRSMLACYHM